MFIAKGLLIKSQYVRDLRITIDHHHRNHFPIMRFLLMPREVKRVTRIKRKKTRLHPYYKPGPVGDNLFGLYQKMISKRYSPTNMFMRVTADWG